MVDSSVSMFNIPGSIPAEGQLFIQSVLMPQRNLEFINGQWEEVIWIEDSEDEDEGYYTHDEPMIIIE
jgi:hypothetical protein